MQLLEALERGPDIISLSAGATTRGQRPLLNFEVLRESHVRHLNGTVLVAAAGNDSTRVLFWPAALPWAVREGIITAVMNFENDATITSTGNITVLPSPVGIFGAGNHRSHWTWSPGW